MAQIMAQIHLWGLCPFSENVAQAQKHLFPEPGERQIPVVWIQSVVAVREEGFSE
jgi:hypothetical protein